MKKISLVSGCYNEENNVKKLYEEVLKQWEKLADKYEFEYIFADNKSSDGTLGKLKEIAAKDKRVKIIVNARNFGHIKSPYYAMMQASGDAIIYLASDLQDPPELIPEFIKKWEDGFKIVVGQKTLSEENSLIFYLRKLYYKILGSICDDGVELISNFTGFGLYDKKVVDIIREIDDPYPYLRGMICDIGFDRAVIEYKQPLRKTGVTKNNFYTLYDNAMLGFTKHSKVPLRFMALTGLVCGFITFVMSVFYICWKLIYWDQFSFGLAPIIVCMLFIGSIQMFCLGILGEYVGAIYSRTNKKPLVVEDERINF